MSGADKGGKVFDDRLCSQDGFQYSGGKGGDKWKTKVERYLVTQVPLLKGLLRWAEVEDFGD